MLTLVIERTRSFDRRIAVRNAMECIAALAVTVFFAWTALASSGGLIERLGLCVTSASGLWIAYYVLRRGKDPRPPDRGVPVDAYRNLLIENYDQQIRLLRTVKYWYLLPPYVGLLIANIGTAVRLGAEGKGIWISVVTMLIVTAVFAAVWYANEVVGVRHLKKLRAETNHLISDRDSADFS